MASHESFQPWLASPRRVRPEVLDVAVAVPVAEVLDPGEGAVGVGQQAGQLLGRQPPPGQLAEQHDEQRRGVDRAVVGRATLQGERVRAVEAGLVHDPAGLLLGPGVDVLALEVGQRLEHAEGQRGIDRQRHQRGPERVAPEQGHEPRSAGGHDGEAPPGGVEQAQRREVGQRALVRPRQGRVVGVQGGSVLDPLGLAGCGVAVRSTARATARPTRRRARRRPSTSPSRSRAAARRPSR